MIIGCLPGQMHSEIGRLVLVQLRKQTRKYHTADVSERQGSCDWSADPEVLVSREKSAIHHIHRNDSNINCMYTKYVILEGNPTIKILRWVFMGMANTLLEVNGV